MKKISFLIIIISLSIFSCANTTKIDNYYQNEIIKRLDTFENIKLSGAFNVKINFTNDHKIRIVGSEKDLEKILFEQKGNSLIVKNKKNYTQYKKIDVYISLNCLEKIDASGANNIEIIDVKQTNMKILLSGANSLYGNGTVENISYNISGASSVNLKELVSEVSNLDISGASNAKIYSKKAISGNVSGVSGLTIYGNPAKNNVTKSALSNIKYK